MKKKVEMRITHPEHSNLFLCEKCMSWDGEFYREASMMTDPIWISISCLCNSLECKKCGHSSKMPGTSIWTLEDDYYAYVSSVTGIKPCSKCGGKITK